jgi:Tfp pilus assembly protein PilF
MNGKTPAAIELYRKTVELDPHNATALNNLAYLLVEANQLDEALKFSQKAKELAPDNPSIEDTLGWTYYQKGMYSLAMTHLQTAVAKEVSARRQYHLAMACLKAGDQNQGRKALEAALKIDPKLPEAQAARQMFGEGVK